MKAKTTRSRRRKSGLRLPTPPMHSKRDKGFSLRVINEADGRFSTVRRLRMRLERLMEDAGIDSIQGEMIAGRAVYICAYLETQELAALEGKKINMARYTQMVNALNGTLNKLGIEKKVKKEIKRYGQ